MANDKNGFRPGGTKGDLKQFVEREGHFTRAAFAGLNGNSNRLNPLLELLNQKGIIRIDDDYFDLVVMLYLDSYDLLWLPESIRNQTYEMLRTLVTLGFSKLEVLNMIPKFGDFDRSGNDWEYDCEGFIDPITQRKVLQSKPMRQAILPSISSLDLIEALEMFQAITFNGIKSTTLFLNVEERVNPCYCHYGLASGFTFEESLKVEMFSPVKTQDGKNEIRLASVFETILLACNAYESRHRHFLPVMHSVKYPNQDVLIRTSTLDPKGQPVFIIFDGFSHGRIFSAEAAAKEIENNNNVDPTAIATIPMLIEKSF